MAEKVSGFVVSVVDDGPAFAIRSDTDESVFIDRNCVDEMDIEEMDEVEMILIRNTAQPDKTPWYAKRLRVID